MKNKLSLLLVLVLAGALVGCSLFQGDSLPTNSNSEALTDQAFKISYEGLDFSQDEILVRASSFDALEEILVGLDAYILKTFDAIGWALVTVPAEKTALDFVAELQNHKVVIMAEPNLEWEIPKPDRDLIGPVSKTGLTAVEPEAEEYDKLWGMKDIRADEAWEITTGSDKVIVVIADTGMDIWHPEFEDHEIIWPHNTCGDEYGGQDIHGHGTHVAGTAAADGRYGMIAGVVWDCPIMPIRVMDLNGYMYNTYIGQAMLDVADYVIENSEYRAVVNMSLGGRGYSQFIKDSIDYAYEQNVLLVAAAGNDYKRVLSYPCAYSGVVSVAASTPHGKKADFSTTGFWNSVAAPGVRIFSTYPSYFIGDPDYVEMQGTSMATPHVCGAVAMLLSHNPDLTPLEIKNQLEATARPGYYGADFGEPLGYGIIDCVAMLGDLEPMKYGSLKVETNIIYDSTAEEGYDYGLVTIFNEDGKMVYFGATGAEGAHNFYAMLPGTYTVTLSYDEKIQETDIVTINVGSEEVLTLNVEFPEA